MGPAEFRSDVDALVQLLRHLHDPGGLEAEAFGRLLLHGGGGEGGRGLTVFFGVADRGDGENAVFGISDDPLGVFGAGERLLFAVLAVVTDGEGLAFPVFERGLHRPVLLRDKSRDLPLALYDDARGDGLDSSGGKSALDRLPEEGTELIADDTVKDPARLLTVDQIHIDRTGMLDRVLDRGLGQLVEGDAVSLFRIDPERRCEMPGNRLSFAVRVGREEDLGGVLRLFFQFLDHVSLSADVDIMRLEAVVDIDAETALRQVADVALGGGHLVICSEIPLDGVGLGGGLHDNQICHIYSLL